jgi:hypothetical protein
MNPAGLTSHGAGRMLDATRESPFTMNRARQRYAALIGVCALLFTTLAVAAYPCPVGAATAESAASDMPDGCPDRNVEHPNLCMAHCTVGQQQTAQAAADLPPMPLVHGLFASLFIPGFVTTASTHHVAGATPLRTTAPPITIRNCCFRL